MTTFSPDKFHLEQVTIPIFEFPWPSDCASDAEIAETEMIQWGDEYQLFPTDQYRTRILRAKYGWMTARCIPKSNFPMLQTLTKCLLWTFLIDDLVVDRVETWNTPITRTLTSLVNLIESNCLSANPGYGEAAGLDVYRRLREQLPLESFHRFAHNMRLYYGAAALQVINHLTPQLPNIETYECIRRYVSGMEPCLDLADASNSGPVCTEEYYDPEVLKLRRHSNNVVSWSNDIHSVSLELKEPGQHWNMAIIYANQLKSLQAGIDRTAERIRSEIHAFTELAPKVEAKASRALRGYITAMKDWMTGHQAWCQYDTYRYSKQFEAEDLDLRGVIPE